MVSKTQGAVAALVVILILATVAGVYFAATGDAESDVAGATAPPIGEQSTWKLQGSFPFTNEDGSTGTTDKTMEQYVDLGKQQSLSVETNSKGTSHHVLVRAGKQYTWTSFSSEFYYQAKNRQDIEVSLYTGPDEPEQAKLDRITLPKNCKVRDIDADIGAGFSGNVEEAMKLVSFNGQRDGKNYWIINDTPMVEQADTRTILTLGDWTVVSHENSVDQSKFQVPAECAKARRWTLDAAPEEDAAPAGDPPAKDDPDALAEIGNAAVRRRLLKMGINVDSLPSAEQDELQQVVDSGRSPNPKHFNTLGDNSWVRLPGTHWCGASNDFDMGNDCSGVQESGVNLNTHYRLTGDESGGGGLPSIVKNNYVYNYYSGASTRVPGQTLTWCTGTDTGAAGEKGLYAKNHDDKYCRQHDLCPLLQGSDASCACDRELRKNADSSVITLLFADSNAAWSCRNWETWCQDWTWYGSCNYRAWEWSSQYVNKYSPSGDEGGKLWGRVGRYDSSDEVCTRLRAPGQGHSWIGDGYCDRSLNTNAYGYDGGDCDVKTCKSSASHTCGVVGYDPKQPGCV